MTNDETKNCLRILAEILRGEMAFSIGLQINAIALRSAIASHYPEVEKSYKENLEYGFSLPDATERIKRVDELIQLLKE